MTSYWLYWKKFDAPYSKWPSLTSCFSQARSLAGHDIPAWDKAPNGPQGNGPHWYPARGDCDLLIIEVASQNEGDWNFYDDVGSGP